MSFVAFALVLVQFSWPDRCLSANVLNAWRVRAVVALKWKLIRTKYKIQNAKIFTIMGVPSLKDFVYLFRQTIGNNLWQTTASQSCSQSHNAQTGMTMWQPWRYRDLCFYELFVKLAARTCAPTATIDERFFLQANQKACMPVYLPTCLLQPALSILQ